MKFRILRGSHSRSEPGPNGEVCERCNGKCRIVINGKEGDWPCTLCKATGVKHVEVVYTARGERNIIDTEVNLEAKFGSEKFQNLDAGVSPGDDALRRRIAELEVENKTLKEEKPELEFSTMNIRQLKRAAEEMGVDVTEAVNKEEIINMLQLATDAA